MELHDIDAALAEIQDALENEHAALEARVAEAMQARTYEVLAEVSAHHGHRGVSHTGRGVARRLAGGVRKETTQRRATRAWVADAARGVLSPDPRSIGSAGWAGITPRCAA